MPLPPPSPPTPPRAGSDLEISGRNPGVFLSNTILKNAVYYVGRVSSNGGAIYRSYEAVRSQSN